MPTAPLNQNQKLVAKHYRDGVFQHHECHIPGGTGDTLFDFLMSEADDDSIAEAQDKGVDPTLILLQRVSKASYRLTGMQRALLKEIYK